MPGGDSGYYRRECGCYRRIISDEQVVVHLGPCMKIVSTTTVSLEEGLVVFLET